MPGPDLDTLSELMDDLDFGQFRENVSNSSNLACAGLFEPSH
jgi:hypothetical protein